MFEVGDLSGKYGSLKNKNVFNGKWLDLNLQIYGPNTILGRSIVIHKSDATGSRLTCSNIEPFNAQVLSGKVDFTTNTKLSLGGVVTLVRKFRIRFIEPSRVSDAIFNLRQK